MKITPKNQVKKHQMGGQMQPSAPVEEPTPTGGAPVDETEPTQETEQDPMVMLGEMAAQAMQTQDCQIAMQVCQVVIEMLQQMQEPAPQEPQGEPVFRKGGILVRRIKK